LAMVVPPIGKVHLHETQHSQKGFILLGALRNYPRQPSR
jgi:hypothetical protein